METIAAKFPDFLIEWFQSRTLNLKTLDLFNIGWSNSVIVIPVYSPEGKFLFNKYRRSPLNQTEGPKYSYDKGGKSTLYGAHMIADEKMVVVAEGELDALCLWSHGIPAVSSTGGSGTFLPEWAELLKDKEVYIWYDNDRAGNEGAIRAKYYLPWAKVVVWPMLYGIKDITDCCTKIVETEDSTDLKNDILKFLERQGANFDLPVKREEEKTKAKKDNIKECEAVINNIRNLRSQAQKDLSSTDIFDVAIQYSQNVISKIKSEIKKKTKTGPSTETLNLVERAKSVPMTNFINFNREGMAPCIFHNEKTASMHYIKGSNKIHCFGCNKTADVVEVVMQLNSCTYKEALKTIL